MSVFANIKHFLSGENDEDYEEYGYEEELNQIRDSIDETFNKLCELWDVIGCVNDGKREERKTTIAASCKNHICQYLDRVYAAEDQVIFLNLV